MSAVTVVGSVNIDMIMRVERLPHPGETLLAREFIMVPGGKGANQAVAARRAGGWVTLVASVGDDEFGRQAIEHLHADGVNIRYINKHANTSSGVAMIFVDDQGENSIGVASGANAALSPADVLHASQAIVDADVVLVQLETPLETVEATVSIAHGNDIPVILNPAPAYELPEALLRKVSLITPNHIEAEMLTGVHVTDRDSARRAAARLHDRGVESVVVTMGSDGLVASSAEGIIELDAYQVSVLDTTAAGDAFNGVLAAALAEGSLLREALRLANVAAAISVTRLGGQPSIPHRAEIDAFLRQHDEHRAATEA